MKKLNFIALFICLIMLLSSCNFDKQSDTTEADNTTFGNTTSEDTASPDTASVITTDEQTKNLYDGKYLFPYDDTWKIGFTGNDVANPEYLGNGKHIDIVYSNSISYEFLHVFGLGYNDNNYDAYLTFCRLHAPCELSNDNINRRDYSTDYGMVYYLTEYFDIPKEDYEKWCKYLMKHYSNNNVSFWNDYYSVKRNKNVFLIPPSAQYEIDAIYSGSPADNERFICEGFEYDGIDTVVKRPDNETTKKYISLYYTIDYRFIAFVGDEKFNSFKSKYYGTEDFNILKFIDEFDIDKEDMLTAYNNTYYPHMYRGVTRYPYNPEYLFGTDEMREEYFSIHPIEYDTSTWDELFADKDLFVNKG